MWVKLHDIPIVAFTEDGLSAMAYKLADREFKEETNIATSNVEDDGVVLYMVRVGYELEPPRCVVCKVFGHDDMTCPHRVVEISKKQSKNTDGFQHVPRRDFLENDDNLVSNGGTSNLGKKVVNDVADSSNETNKVSETNKVGDDLYATSIPSTSNMTFKKLDYLVNANSDSEVKEGHHLLWSPLPSVDGSKINKIAKNGSGMGNKSLYERWKETYHENPYNDDDFDDRGLSETHMAFANAFDISLSGQLR
ncbi:hypothetical protein Tco_1203771 [Tanacetum coccineum]